MTKELVDKAKILPPKQQIVVDRATECLTKIKTHEDNIKSHQESIDSCNCTLNVLKQELKLLETGKYKVVPSNSYPFNCHIEFEKD